MDLFTKLFGHLLLFVYHCFDRIVIHGYLSGLSRPEQVVYFFRQVVGQPVVDKATLSQRTSDYQNWVEAYARIELPWKAITHSWNPFVPLAAGSRCRNRQ